MSEATTDTEPDQDVIHRFSFTHAAVRGQWVRLDATLDEAFRRQPHPEPARRLLAEMLAAVSLVADGLKFDGTVALQSRGNGPIGTALAECRERGKLRGIVRWREGGDLAGGPVGAETAGAAPGLSSLLGDGQLAITLTPQAGQDGVPYQGVVAISRASLTSTLEAYFENSEQLPTRLITAFGEGRVTGLLLQRLPERDGHDADAASDAWQEIELLARTLRATELAELSPPALLRRLFPRHTLTLHPPRRLEFSCTCSRERAERMLGVLPRDEILELLESRGCVDVTCEICGATYQYDQVDTHQIYQPGDRRLH